MPTLMPSPVFRWFVAAQNGTGLVPAADYKAKFFQAGTAPSPTFAKAIYHSDGTIYPDPSNEAVLNSEGYADILLGSGNYLMQITDPDDAQVYIQDNIQGGSSFGTGFVGTVVATDDPETNGLAQLDTANQFTYCAGYYEIGDGGEGFFWNEASSTPDDGGYVIASTFDPTRRWFRIPDEDFKIRAASFGYIGTRDEDLTSQFSAAEQYAQTNAAVLVIGPGTAATIGSEFGISLYSPYIEFTPGSALTATPDSTATITMEAIVTGPPEQIFIGWDSVAIFSPGSILLPQWFGGSNADPSFAANTSALNLWAAANQGGQVLVLPPGNWKYTDPTAFPYPVTTPMLLNGNLIADTEGTDRPTGVYYPFDSIFRLGLVEFENGRTLSGASGARITTDGELGASASIFAGDSVAATINVTAGADITAGVDVNAANDVNAARDVVAERYLKGAAGTSGNYFVAGGQIANVIGSSTTSGTSLTTLLSYTLTENTLVNDGDRIAVRLAGTTGGSTGIKIYLFVGGQEAFQMVTGVDAGGDYWDISVDVYKNSTGFISFGIGGILVPTNLSSPQAILGGTETHVVNFAAVQTVAVKASVTSGSVTNKLLSVVYYPAAA